MLTVNTRETRETREVPHCIAQSDTPEADTPKQDGANRSLFVYYEINETCTANWKNARL